MKKLVSLIESYLVPSMLVCLSIVIIYHVINWADYSSKENVKLAKRRAECGMVLYGLSSERIIYCFGKPKLTTVRTLDKEGTQREIVYSYGNYNETQIHFNVETDKVVYWNNVPGE